MSSGCVLFLNILRDRGIEIAARGGEIFCRPRSALIDSDFEFIEKFRNDLLGLVGEKIDEPLAGFPPEPERFHGLDEAESLDDFVEIDWWEDYLDSRRHLAREGFYDGHPPIPDDAAIFASDAKGHAIKGSPFPPGTRPCDIPGACRWSWRGGRHSYTVESFAGLESRLGVRSSFASSEVRLAELFGQNYGLRESLLEAGFQYDPLVRGYVGPANKVIVAGVMMEVMTRGELEKRRRD